MRPADLHWRAPRSRLPDSAARRSNAIFAADGAGGAIASTPGFGGFTLTVSPGDTALATWTLVNTDPSLLVFNQITAITIDLTPSGIALFDDGTLPSTPDSGAGVAGVLGLGGVGIAASGELLPWIDAANLGDLYRAESVVFSGSLSAGAFASWSDDTDVIASVPEPGTAGLALLALCAALRTSRHRREA